MSTPISEYLFESLLVETRPIDPDMSEKRKACLLSAAHNTLGWLLACWRAGEQPTNQLASIAPQDDTCFLVIGEEEEGRQFAWLTRPTQLSVGSPIESEPTRQARRLELLLLERVAPERQRGALAIRVRSVCLAQLAVLSYTFILHFR